MIDEALTAAIAKVEETQAALALADALEARSREASRADAKAASEAFVANAAAWKELEALIKERASR